MSINMKLLFILTTSIVLQANAQTVEFELLNTIRQSIAQNRNEELTQATRKMTSRIAQQVPNELLIPLGTSAAQSLAKPDSDKNLATLIARLETALRAKDMQLAYQHAVVLNQLAARKWFYETDHEKNYRSALVEAQTKPSFQTYSMAQLQAMNAKQNAATLEYADKVWLLRSEDTTAKLIAEPVHHSQQMGAMAAFELGQIDKAASLLLRSLDLPGRRWGPSSPDMKVADLLLQKQQRLPVIGYLEACLKKDWPNRTPYLKQWLDEIKSGKTPILRFPLQAMAVSPLN